MGTGRRQYLYLYLLEDVYPILFLTTEASLLGSRRTIPWLVAVYSLPFMLHPRSPPSVTPWWIVISVWTLTWPQT